MVDRRSKEDTEITSEVNGMRIEDLIKEELERFEDEMDPMLSVINMIDAFLAVVIALLLVLIHSPFSPFSSESYIVIKNPNRENMEMIIKEGKKLERYVRSDQIGEGRGVRVGVTYRLPDGTLVYVPED